MQNRTHTSVSVSTSRSMDRVTLSTWPQRRDAASQHRLITVSTKIEMLSVHVPLSP